MVVIAMFVVSVMANLVPLSAVPAGEVGRSAINYGLPFTVFSTSTASYPSAPTISEFYIWGLIANVVIVCVVVVLAAYAIHSLRSISKKSQVK